MFNLIGKLNYIQIKKQIKKVSKKNLKRGLNLLDNYFITNLDGKIAVFDRTCDHQGGKIISKDNKHICPIHNWEFFPERGLYNNGIIKKQKKFTIKKDQIFIEEKKSIPKISNIKKNSEIKVRFFNHAFLQISTDEFKFATDPWAIGPAFNSGWWLVHKTKKDWLDELNSCSFIYISHNHPDHLHPLTLSKIRKDIPIIVPNFVSDSVGNYMESLGFKNIIRLDFQKEYQFKKTNLIISVLKSGDFREDSGIYFSIGKTTFLFDVDSNMINFNRLPNVDIYASSFAGGAGGYPLMFENYNENDQRLILKKEKNLKRKKNELRLTQIKPKYFIPYAGFFENKLSRDKRIKVLNQKNKIKDYEKLCKDLNIKLLNVENMDEYYFKNQLIINQGVNKNSYFNDIKPNDYLNYFKQNFKNIDNKYIKTYFKKSNFKDNLILKISLTDDNFKKSFLSFKVDFSKDKISFNILKTINDKNFFEKNKSIKYLYLKCRKESFLSTIYNKSPWEDLLIGFQCKVLRHPNQYNFKFWHHFTNFYIGQKNIRFSSDCSNCEKISQFFDNKVYGSNSQKLGI